MGKIRLWNNVTKAVFAVLVLVSLASAQTWVELFPVGGPSGPILGRQPAVSGYDDINNRLTNRLLSQQSCSLTEPPR